LLTDFHSFIKKNNLFQKNDTVLLTVSGGVDSVVMCELFYQSGFLFAIAHCNFKLRGKDSDEDEAFVSTLAKKYNVQFFTMSFNTQQHADDNKISIQMAARELRYNWFEDVRHKNKFNFIATAHHHDDNIETVLLHLTKGTGIRGLKGIPAKQDKIIRPLLFADKKAIIHFAGKNNLQHREDASNSSTKYERNKLRLDVIPKLEEINPSFSKSFGDSITYFNDAVVLFDDAMRRLKKKITREENGVLYISIPKLIHDAAHSTILFELLQPYGFNGEQVKQIIEHFKAEPGALFFSDTHRLLKDRKELIVTLSAPSLYTEDFILPETKEVQLVDFIVKIEIIPIEKFHIKRDKNFTALDYDKLQFPLMVRRWKAGDYFYPFGMKKKKKKISNFLIDQKVSLVEKEKTYVLLSGGKICAVIGNRPDERFVVTGKTKKVWQLELIL
jgi:tRNA(Ile)-lysidine synthase